MSLAVARPSRGAGSSSCPLPLKCYRSSSVVDPISSHPGTVARYAHRWISHVSASQARAAEPSRGAFRHVDRDRRRGSRRDLRLKVSKRSRRNPPAAAGPVAAPKPSLGPVAAIFRPTVRLAVAVLTVCDDGKLDGEVIRIRSPKFVIGRTEGDLKIPIDGRMSSRHVEITLQAAAERTGGLSPIFRARTVCSCASAGPSWPIAPSSWSATADTASTRLRPRPTPRRPPSTNRTPQVSGETQGWADSASPFRPPAVTELVGNEIGNRMLLVKPEYWIGTDATCPICRSDDPFCEPRHVRLFRLKRLLVRRAQQDPERPLAAHVSDRGRFRRPLSNRRATVSAQGLATNWPAII